jgi:hypothetical protein
LTSPFTGAEIAPLNANPESSAATSSVRAKENLMLFRSVQWYDDGHQTICKMYNIVNVCGLLDAGDLFTRKLSLSMSDGTAKFQLVAMARFFIYIVTVEWSCWL